MVYRDRKFIEDIDSTTRIRMSDLASLDYYSPNSREGWVFKALSSEGPSTIFEISRWVSRNGGPSKVQDSIWTMLDEGTLEIV